MAIETIFNLAALFFFGLGFVFFFVNGLWAVGLLVVGYLLSWGASQMPGSKAAMALQEAEKKKLAALQEAEKKKLAALQEKARREFDQKIDLLKREPDNASLLTEIVEMFNVLTAVDLKHRVQTAIIPLLLLAPLNDQIRQAALGAAQKVVGNSISQKVSAEFYAASLQCLDQYPTEPKLKQYVLEVGRWHFGKLRGGAPSVYDEQAIQNDILVRSKN